MNSSNIRTTNSDFSRAAQGRAELRPENEVYSAFSGYSASVGNERRPDEWFLVNQYGLEIKDNFELQYGQIYSWVLPLHLVDANRKKIIAKPLDEVDYSQPTSTDRSSRFQTLTKPTEFFTYIHQGIGMYVPGMLLLIGTNSALADPATIPSIANGGLTIPLNLGNISLEQASFPLTDLGVAQTLSGAPPPTTLDPEPIVASGYGPPVFEPIPSAPPGVPPIMPGNEAVSDGDPAAQDPPAADDNLDSTIETQQLLQTVVNDGSNTETAPPLPPNEAPILAGSSVQTFTENAGPLVINPGAVISDLDQINMTGATVQITSHYQNGADVLGFAAQNGITGSFNAATGILSLSGSASIVDYQTALNSVTYQNTSHNPSNLDREISFRVSDGIDLSAPITSTVQVIPVNDAPINHLLPSYTTQEDTPFVLTGLSVTDVDASSGNISVTLNVTNGLLSINPAVVGGVSAGNMSGNNTTQVVLTGTLSQINATLADVNGVTFTPAGNLTLSQFTMFTTDLGNTGAGNVLTAFDSRVIDIVQINDPPVLVGGSTITFIENTGFSIPLNPNAFITDDDNTSMSSATVQITGNYQNGADSLIFTNQNGIVGSFDALTGTLNLTGVASNFFYRLALNSVSYFNNSDNPGANRTVSYKVNDGTNNSNSIMSTVNIISINDLPTATANSITYTENGVPLSFGITVNDVDDVNLNGMTVAIISNYQNAGRDVLGFTNQSGITGSFSNSTGILTLSGSATLAQYQAAVSSITYVNTSEAPSGLTRTYRVIVTDGSGGISSSITGQIPVIPVNDAPIVSNSTTAAWIEGASSANVLANLTVTDVDSPNLVGATVSFTSGYLPGEDVLAQAGVFAGISFSYNATLGILSLSGSASRATYQSALRSVRYTNSAGVDPTSGTKTLVVQVDDGSASNNLSGLLSNTLTVQAVNSVPIMSGGVVYGLSEPNGAGSGPGTPLAIVHATGGVISDNDDTSMASARMFFAAGYKPGLHVLSFTDTATITGSFNSATGILTLTGSDTNANYTLALRSITFINSDDNPGAGSISIHATVNDGLVDSNPYVANYQSFVAFNDAPINTLSSLSNATLNIASNLTGISVADPDANSGNLTVTFTVSSGSLSASNAIVGGVTTVSGNGTNSVQLTGTLTQINTTLAAATGLMFTGNSLSDVTLTMLTNDGGNTGVGGALIDTDISTIKMHPFTFDMSAPSAAFTDTLSESVVGSYAGFSLGGGGNFNGNGFNDIVISGTGALGRAYVVNGAADTNLNTLNGSNGFVITAVGAGATFGAASSMVGDFNGDGRDDVLVSAPGNGSAYLIYGATSPAASIDATLLDGSNGFILTGPAGNFAQALADGDINGDGKQDLLLSSGTSTYVVYGTSANLGVGVDVTTLNGSNGFVITNLAGTINGSLAVTDFNGDGFRDIIMGSENYNGSEGGITVVFGSESGLPALIDASTLSGTVGANPHGFNFLGTAGGTVDHAGSTVAALTDFNGDGYGDLVIGAANLDQAYIFYGSNAAINSGSFSASDIGGALLGITISGAGSGETLVNVANAGDFNGDGYTDLLIATENAAHTSDTVYLVYGSNAPTNINLASFTANEGLVFTNIDPVSVLSGSNSNWLHSLGDVNGDGYDDFAIGDPNTALTTSAANIIYGFSSETTQVVSASSTTINASSSFANVIQSTGNNNTINGGSLNDILIGGANNILNGGAGNDSLRASTGNIALNGGAGNDLLWGGHGDNTFGYNLATDGASTDIVHGIIGGSWVDTIDLSGMSQGPSATLGAVGSWLLVIDGDAFTSVATSGSNIFANPDQSGIIQIQVTVSTVETIRFDNIEKIQWHA